MADKFVNWVILIVGTFILVNNVTAGILEEMSGKSVEEVRMIHFHLLHTLTAHKFRAT